MVELDGDDIRISSRGKLAERDIVQVTLETLSDQSKKRESTFHSSLTFISRYELLSSSRIAETPFLLFHIHLKLIWFKEIKSNQPLTSSAFSLLI